MKFSTSEDYGLILARKLAKNYPKGPISLKKIAEEEGLSFLYLEQLAAKLKKADLIKGIRGTKGGYELAKDPEKIKVSELIKALEEPIKLVKCDHLAQDEASCHKINECATRNFWLYLHKDIITTLGKISLADLSKNKINV